MTPCTVSSPNWPSMPACMPGPSRLSQARIVLTHLASRTTASTHRSGNPLSHHMTSATQPKESRTHFWIVHTLAKPVSVRGTSFCKVRISPRRACRHERLDASSLSQVRIGTLSASSCALGCSIRFCNAISVPVVYVVSQVRTWSTSRISV